MRHAFVTAAFLLSAVAYAQGPARQKIPTDQDTLVTAEQLQSLLDNAPVSKDTGKPGSLSAQLFGRVGNCAFIRINEPDKPHAHGDTSEIFVIQSGTGSLETGGEMVGPFTGNSAVHSNFFVNGPGSAQPGAPAPAAAGEVQEATGNGGGAARSGAEGGPHNGSGTAVAGGRTQKVKAGDVVLVPAGVPHHWVAIDQPIVYLDIKYPKAQ
jgi:mannose-6-phosphate isomerase-like protein (cupin superfamily)